LNSALAAQQALALNVSAEERQIAGIQSAITEAGKTLTLLGNSYNNVNTQITNAKNQGLNLNQKLNSAISAQNSIANQVESAKNYATSIKAHL
jgi:hypothetical protein